MRLFENQRTGHKQTITVTLIIVILFMSFSPACNVIAADVSDDINIGPYMETVVFKEIGDSTLALMSGTIDIDDRPLQPQEVQPLVEDPDISIFNTLRNGYGYITINCREYPLNISAFRRAFAYAFDKTRVQAEVLWSYSRLQDSLVPYANDWCIEDIMPYHYYNAEVVIGAQILDDANFSIDPITGYRNAPDGSPFDVILEYPSNPDVEAIALPIASIGVDALQALDVNAQSHGVPFDELRSRMYNHGEFDMAFSAYDFHSDAIDWLAFEYWSLHANYSTFTMNAANFVNTTYDSWRDQLLYGETYDEVYEAAYEMQMILHHNVPRLVVYQNQYLQAYRNDKFTGHIEDFNRYIAGVWTLRKIHKIDGSLGGTVFIAAGEPASFNIFADTTVYATLINDNLWPRLYLRGPHFEYIPYLAESLLEETHSENPDVQEGHTKFTFEIVKNATWTDGTPITAEDVARTFIYGQESWTYGNPASAQLVDLVAAYAPTSHKVILEFDTKSYWHFYNLAYQYIIPSHIFNETGGVAYTDWRRWNPVYNPTEPYVTAGPFTLTDFEMGEFTEISANPSFWFYPTDETTTPTTPTRTAPPFDAFLALVAGGVGVAAVILVAGFVMIKRKTD